MFEFLSGLADWLVWLGTVPVLIGFTTIVKRGVRLTPLSEDAVSFVAHATPPVVSVLLFLIPDLRIKGADTWGMRLFFFLSMGFAATYIFRGVRLIARKKGYGGVFDSERPTEAPPA